MPPTRSPGRSTAPDNEPGGPRPSIVATLRRYAILTAVLALVIGGGLVVYYLIKDHVPAGRRWQAAWIGVETLRWVHLAASLGLIVVVPVLGFGLARVRGRGERRPELARALLLAGSILLGLAVAEIGAAAWLALARQAPPVVAAAESSIRQDLPLPPRQVPIELPAPVEAVALPTDFPDSTGLGPIDLVVVGESSAEGVPFNLAGISIGTLVASKLAEALPDRPIQVKMVAQSGHTLEHQHRHLARLERRPDLVIVYAGHNEFSARMSWAREPPHYLDADDPTGPERLAAAFARLSPLSRLINAAVEKCRISIPPPRGGHRRLVDVPAYTPAEYAELRDNFGRRLEAIVAWAESVGALPVLILPPANDAAFEPNRSFLPPETTRADREAFDRDFRAARDLEASDPAEALARFRALAERAPGFAEARFRLGLALAEAGRPDEAYEHFVAARDADGLPMRLPSDFQAHYHEVAARGGRILIDGQALLRDIGERGLLDETLFIDMMHPSLRGHLALAQGVLAALQARGAFGLDPEAAPPRFDPDEVARRYGLGPGAWRGLSTWAMMMHDLVANVPHDPSGRLARMEAYGEVARRIDAGVAPEAAGLPSVGVPPPVPPTRAGVDPFGPR